MSSNPDEMYVIGLMSGSSLDGLDLALCRFTSDQDWEYIQGQTINFDDDLRSRLATIDTLSLYDYQDLDVAFCRLCADAIRVFAQSIQHPIHLISSHGHTVCHHPERGHSLQMGSGASISALSGYPVACDFRQGDVALSGQGAPLASLVDRQLFQQYDAHLNLGGIANVSISINDRTMAFDIGPCNQILNLLSRKLNLDMDRNGDIARSGKVNQALLHELMSIPYFHESGPKSLDNGWVTGMFWPVILQSTLEVKNKLATVVECIAQTIHESLKPFAKANNQRILATGGGAHNGYLISRISEVIGSSNYKLEIPENYLINYKEAILMAYMGYLRWNNKTNVLSTATGASRDSIGGAIYMV